MTDWRVFIIDKMYETWLCRYVLTLCSATISFYAADTKKLINSEWFPSKVHYYIVSMTVYVIIKLKILIPQNFHLIGCLSINDTFLFLTIEKISLALHSSNLDPLGCPHHMLLVLGVVENHQFPAAVTLYLWVGWCNRRNILGWPSVAEKRQQTI